jgi:hypothetical protein
MPSGNVMPRGTNTADEGGGGAGENASLDARITDLEGKIADLDEAFYAQGQEGQEGKPGSEGTEGTEGPGGEVRSDGTTTETFLEEVKPNGEIEPPLSERKIERKGGITKTNLKIEAEKEGFNSGGAIGNAYVKSPLGPFASFHENNEKRLLLEASTKDRFVLVSLALKIKAKAGKGINVTISLQSSVNGELQYQLHTFEALENEPAGRVTLSLILLKGNALEAVYNNENENAETSGEVAAVTSVNLD